MFTRIAIMELIVASMFAATALLVSHFAVLLRNRVLDSRRARAAAR
jgi:hypothetical protein